ncbi:MAG: excinuclease ABC subunit UvrA [Thermodesulfovibrio sp.]|uniref:excinuclease ABC subunit UvrA n=1 Tax=unclassified Thermodesulfovibrio TaxID=2645936 RepID=UPI00083B113A|nr:MULTISPECIES: excinuclease ABC subunit UvrA [unclassified Thermodesulfovibrio]MDI1472882.1 excinuclease ABC subunit UvrA [Thermodesulfovibrio sp. 1176]MDI6714877.1 excinuclease ABC subunit UvrA [Thermodesulfovibrio sp.]ODA44737.1 Excinuclease ABC subunit A [Thermodesulfovibrio sp. N1]
MSQNYIVIKGARQHNLKNLNLSLPRNKLIVITGPSGSGKSSLAIDTIFAEAHRRYLQSLPIESRTIFEQIQKPDIDYIEGLSPAISVDQKTISKSPRSTVGTITEIYDYLRLLFAKIGKPFCPKCGRPLHSQDINKMIDTLLSLPAGTKIQVLSPIVIERKGEHRAEIEKARAEGFIRARIDGKIVDLTQDISLKKNIRHTIELVVDRIIVKENYKKQIRRALELALKHSNTIVVNIVEEDKDLIFSSLLSCPSCGINLPDIEPKLFSFNSKYGACPKCRGLGFENIESEEEEIDEISLKTCSLCNGNRLRQEALAVKINGKNIAELSNLTLDELEIFIRELSLSSYEKKVSDRIIKEIFVRLQFLKKIGISYLSLNRPSFSLSGGEAQRIRLATQLGSHLSGVLYVLDEPSIGLHPRDFSKLIESLKELKEKKNTLIIVEHDESTIKNADLVVELGPEGGEKGGYLVTVESPEKLLSNPSSITGKYLSEKEGIKIPKERRKPKGFIRLYGAEAFNLKNIDVKIPLGVFLCVTGVAGSGKSTLIFEILYKALMRELYGSDIVAGKFRAIEGIEQIDKVVCIDQSPIGRTSRSTPATYTQVMNEIRELFAMLPEARIRGYTKSRFSFNLSGGRCESCQGDGMKRIKMHLLPDVYVMCDSCKGKRYNDETLKITYKGKSISDILEMTVSEALEFFSAVPRLKHKLQLMEDIGLGYIKLGQPATTLSGGEAQRVKLTKELSKKATGKTLYILDEPTTGLHMIDIERLLSILQRLVENGNTVIVIEHDIDIIKCADYIIDLGPEGGTQGGYIVAEGTPEEVAMNSSSYTGKFLRKKLGL